ncbi:hypothetical protein [Glaciibacter psychrotolerans]|uniref:Uncharacterized protein n=1 Tax=Glaciibacter psychrotolerans TaxID=670054 RepID=A0A7Z0EED5_9MICO|nr:hypothetical protein [Leifsonia psychrotolerans]NYJ19409.1 hypothetical protein [Leifsonia psychrotolerans]
MRRRRDSDESATSHAGTGFGVGVQVVVRLDRSNYPGTLILDPAGVIVAPGETLGAAFFAPLSRREPVWEVQFEEPFIGLDGSGPHDSARVPEGQLEIAPEA